MVQIVPCRPSWIWVKVVENRNIKNKIRRSVASRILLLLIGGRRVVAFTGIIDVQEGKEVGLVCRLFSCTPIVK